MTAEHPPFDAGADRASPIPSVPELVYPPQPAYKEPVAPKGLAGAFGGKKKHAEAVAAGAGRPSAADLSYGTRATQRKHAEHIEALAARETAEAERLVKLAEAEAAYQAECAQREADAAAKNEELTKFINDLAFDVEYAIEDYVGIVLVELGLPRRVPGRARPQASTWPPASSPCRSTSPSRRVAAVGQGVPVRQGQGRDRRDAAPGEGQKDRYTAAVHQVAVRTLHEVFEADRAGKIHSIALTVGVNRVAPATGQPETCRSSVVAADRETFNSFDLANVVPSATLDHLGAALSKSPFDLTPADTSRGVRRGGQ